MKRPGEHADGWVGLAFAILAAIGLAFLVGCAIPVRPIAKLAPGKDGIPHFIPDPEQEPTIGAFIPDVLPGLLTGLGGAGTIAGGILAYLKAKEAARCRADADEGWTRAVTYAEKLPTEATKGA